MLTSPPPAEITIVTPAALPLAAGPEPYRL